MDRNGGYRHYNYNVLYNEACDLAVNIKNQLQQPNQLPQHCNLVLQNNGQMNQFETYAHIEFTTPRSNHTGYVLVGHSEFMQRNIENPDLNGYIHMSCSVDAFNGYFMEISVNTLEDIFSVVEFCQNLLDYQPDGELDFVRIPNHMLNHWCIPEHLRNRHLQLQNLNEN
jgi:hypothetical protein